MSRNMFISDLTYEEMLAMPLEELQARVKRAETELQQHLQRALQVRRKLNDIHEKNEAAAPQPKSLKRRWAGEVDQKEKEREKEELRLKQQKSADDIKPDVQ